MMAVRSVYEFQTTDTVKNTWLCEHVRLLLRVSEQISFTLRNIHSFTPTCTNAANIVAVD